MDGEKLIRNNTVEEGDARPRREGKELFGEGFLKQPRDL